MAVSFKKCENAADWCVASPQVDRSYICSCPWHAREMNATLTFCPHFFAQQAALPDSLTSTTSCNPSLERHC